MARNPGLSVIEGPPSSPENVGGMPLDYVDNVRVRSYGVDISLNLKAGLFQGVVKISMIVSDNRRFFYLHSTGLRIFWATIGGVYAGAFHLSDSVTKFELPVNSGIGPGQITVEVSFEGDIKTDELEGLYMVKGAKGSSAGSAALGETDNSMEEVRGRGWSGMIEGFGEGFINMEKTESGKDDIMVGTHLEPTHCRKVFPCLDMPSRKAVFQLTLCGIPVGLDAISNTPVLSVSREDDPRWQAGGGGQQSHRNTVDGGGNGLKTVAFHPTPVMSTYVLGFWVCDFQTLSTLALSLPKDGNSEDLPQHSASSSVLLEREPEPVKISVHLPTGVDLGGGHFALQYARRAFELFSRLFLVRFPLPKLDLLCLPRMHGLGMENFGAITILQEYFLVTPETEFVRRRRIVRLLCHEICHQWYGDIVTPQSFDELWLKEGLARFFECVAVDTLDSDSTYHIWTNFMSEVYFQAMLADAQVTSHPVVQHHNGNIQSILSSFDTITYGKGACILRMLCQCVGPERFLAGMQVFIAEHQYGSATQEDLWRAIQEVCDRDGLPIKVHELMRPWLNNDRCPVLSVRLLPGSNVLRLKQRPFSFYCLDKVRSNGCEVGQEGSKVDSMVGGDNHTGASRGQKQEPIYSHGIAAVGGTNVEPGEGGGGGTMNDSSNGGRRWMIPLRIRIGGRVKQGAMSGVMESEGILPGNIVRSVISEGGQVGSGAWGGGQERTWVGGRPGAEADSLGSNKSPEGEEIEVVCTVIMDRDTLDVDLDRFLSESYTSPAPGPEQAQSSQFQRPSSQCQVGGDVNGTGIVEGGSSGGCKREPFLEVADGDTGMHEAGARGEKGTGAETVPEPWTDSSARIPCTYVVLNHEHSGFFTLQYECERSWDLALGALTAGRLSECEAMGLVYDVILGLHEGVLNENSSGNVEQLFGRLQQAVKVLGVDRSHPAWCPGQQFLWELLLVCASNALAECREWHLRVTPVGGVRESSQGDSGSGDGEQVLAVMPLSGVPEELAVEDSIGSKSVGEDERMVERQSIRIVAENLGGGSNGGSEDQDSIECGTTCSTSDDHQREPGRHGSNGNSGDSKGDANCGNPAVKPTAGGRGKGVAFEGLDRGPAVFARLVEVLHDVQEVLLEVDEQISWHRSEVECGQERAGEQCQSLCSMRALMEQTLREGRSHLHEVALAIGQ